MHNGRSLAEIREPRHAEPREISWFLRFSSTLIFVLTMLGLSVFVAMAAYGRMPEVFGAIKDFTESQQYYPLYLIVLPIVTGIFCAYFGRSVEDMRDLLALLVAMMTMFICLSLYPQILDGGYRLSMPRVLGYGLLFSIDMFSLTVMTVASVVWTLVLLYAPYYMAREFHRNRFSLFLNVTYGTVMGTLMAGDIFTMFLFFEIMTFSSYLLVVHTETPEANSAGELYIYMGVTGGLCILFGMILLFIKTQTLEFLPLVSELESLGWTRYLILTLFLIGFGIKAGMVPLHVWLPKAHPAAPTPASALLSGVMIKVGAYGILRVTTSFLFPDALQIEGHADVLWNSARSVGAVIVWMGIATMGVGAFMAIQQGHMKRMLAYSSVSQIGYVIMGIGVGVYLGFRGPMGFAGALYHIVNHALFKALLFMAAGAVYLQTHEMDMYKLGGLWRRMPFTALVCLIAALGVTGMPLFNGFASKTLLHHAIEEAALYGHHVFAYAEILFTIISAGTACYFIKFFGFVFLGELPERYREIGNGYRMMDMAMAGLALIIVFIGVNPRFVLDRFLIPAVLNLNYDPSFVGKYVAGVDFFTPADLTGSVNVYLAGAVIFALGIKFHLLNLHFPHWLRFEYILFYPLYRVTEWICNTLNKENEDALERESFVEGSSSVRQEHGDEDASADDGLIHGMSTAMNVFTEDCEDCIERSEGLVRRIVRTLKLITRKYETSIIRSDVVIYAVVLTVLLAVLVIFH